MQPMRCAVEVTLKNIAEVDAIRTASRALVRELGFMETTLASTQHSASAVHALLEIARDENITSGKLASLLQLDKSSVSRMVAKLIKTGEVCEVTSEKDARIKVLCLSDTGRTTVENINAIGRTQVDNAFQHLNTDQRLTVHQGLHLYANALKEHRLGEPIVDTSTTFINTGYLPGLIGRITELHSTFYSTQAGFGKFFESKVASDLAEFVRRLERPCNQVWTAQVNDTIAGSIAIDGEDLSAGTAHLRWFILDEVSRGKGLGRKMMSRAIDFCDKQGFTEVHLWTFSGLESARKLYESFGFQLEQESPGSQWGEPVIEQKFVRVRPSM